MRIWVDDERPMPEEFDIQVSSLTELQEQALWPRDVNVELISLDHDLGGSETGYDIASYIEREASVNQVEQFDWRIHSSNPVGRKRIRQAMENADEYWRRRDQPLDDWQYLEDIWELQLVNNEKFIEAMSKLAEDLENVELDPEVEEAILS